MKEKMEAALNEQINAELYSGYFYLSMSAYFESINLPGFAKWMKMQEQEEIMHATKFYHFIQERGGRVLLKPIQGPPTAWNSPLHVFEEGYKHEQHVSELINNLVDLAIKEKDHAANIFLQWFVTEQVEEEASFDAIVQQLKMIGDNNTGLLMLDRELGTRVFNPAPEGE